MSLTNVLTIKETVSKDNPHSSSFTFHYLWPTMGLTMGNCLRRVLLTSIKGLALVGLEINDKSGPAKSKFTALNGVRETAPELILNCKKIVLETKKKDEVIHCLKLDVKNELDQEYTVTANDLQLSSDYEIKNPNLYLAKLAPFSNLSMKLYWREDYGYHQSEEQKKYLLGKENIIVLDTDYSPVKGDGVNFQINSVVVGLEEEKEELVLSIATTGTITPKEALQEALKIIGHVVNISQEALTKK